jgi:hypothetical protein
MSDCPSSNTFAALNCSDWRSLESQKTRVEVRSVRSAATALARPKSITLTTRESAPPDHCEDHKVARFQIAMHQLVRLRRHERPSDPGPTPAPACRQRTIAAHTRFERFALDQFHRIETLARSGFAEAEDAGHIGCRNCAAARAHAETLGASPD